VDLPVEMVQEADGARSNYHLAVIQSSEREYLRRALEAEGIETSIHYPIPCHKQPALDKRPDNSLPVAEAAAQRIISLPMGPHVTQADTMRVAQAIGRALDASPKNLDDNISHRKYAT
jgi:dTDP-4-amino-4,6-dideoxygalactose transaminase